MSGPNIRLATVGDAASLLQLDTNIFGASSYSEAQWLTELATPSAMPLIAEQQQPSAQSVGFLSASLVGDDLEIRKIGVIASERRSGIAGRLLRESAERAVELLPPAARCLIDVAVDNLPALAFYNALGFTQLVLRKRYYASGADAIVMQKILSGV